MKLNITNPTSIRSEISVFLQSGDSTIGTLGQKYDDFLKLLPPSVNDDTISYLEDLLILFYDFYRSRSVMDMGVAVVSFLKKNKIEKSLFKTVLSLFGDMETIVLQSTDINEETSTFKSFLDYWPRLRASTLWKKTSKAMIYVMSLSLFTDSKSITMSVVDQLSDKFASSSFSQIGDMIHTVLDWLLYICQRGWVCFTTGSLDSILHSESGYDSWYTAVLKHINQSTNLSNPAPHDIDVHKFFATTEKLITKGEEILRLKIGLDVYTTNILRLNMAKLLSIRSLQINVEAAQKNRKSPFCILLAGHSSVAKTTFAQILHSVYAKVMDKDEGPANRYTLNCAAKYWDSFTSSQWSLLLDDIAFMHPDKVAELDETLAVILRVLNNAPFCPDQAAIENKGKTPFLGELVVATTNTPTLSVDSYFAYPYAVARRFPYTVTISPKKELSKDEISINPTKLDYDMGDYPDWWKIVVSVPVPRLTNNNNGKLVPVYADHKIIHEFENIEDFIVFYCEAILNHVSIQDKVIASDTNLLSVVLCKTCYKTRGCVCEREVDLQSLTIDDVIVDVREICGNCFALLGWLIERFIIFLVNHTIFYTIPWLLSRESYCINIVGYWLVWTFGFTQYYPYIVRARGIMLSRMAQKCMRIEVMSLVACITFYSFYVLSSRLFQQEDNVSLQGNVISNVKEVLSDIGSRPESKNEPDSVWKKPTFEFSSFEVGRLTSSWKGFPRHEIEKIVLRNSCFLYFRKSSNTGWTICRGLIVKGQLCMVTNHSIPTFVSSMRCKIVLGPVGNNVSENTDFTLSHNDIEVLDNDVALITLRHISPKKDLTQLFVTKQNTTYRGPAEYLGRCQDGSSFSHRINHVFFNPSFNNLPLGQITSIWQGVVDKPTSDGDCGSALIVFSVNGPFILGLHQWMADNKTETGAVQVYREMFDTKESILPSKPLLSTPTVAVELQVGIHSKSPLNWLDKSDCNVYGSISGHRAHGKSRVEKTLAFDIMTAFGYEDKFGVPDLGTWKLWRNSLIELVKNDNTMDLSLLDAAGDAMFDDWLENLSSLELSMYDFETSVNGVDGLKYVDSINRSTSAGFPWRKSKKYLLTQREGVSDRVDVAKEVRTRCNDLLLNYFEGKRNHPIFTASPKDEPLKYSKIASNKVRIFMGSPLDFTLVTRMLLNSFVRLVQTNKTTFESAPGTVAQCVEWEHLREFLIRKGESRSIFGDFTGFDKSMRPPVMLKAFELIARLHERAGCDADHVLAIKTLAHDICFPLVDYHGDLIEFFGKNPSGQALTVIINGIVNCLYMRYCYGVLAPEGTFISSFRENVSLLTYGDDNAMCVSANAPWFNHCSLTSALADINITYTMADKGALSVPYIAFSEGSFLKRKWRYDTHLHHYVCPLEKDSIIKMLMVHVKSNVVTPEMQMADCIVSANNEWFWHGKEIFYMWHYRLLHMIDELHLGLYFMTQPLLTWDSLADRYDAASQDYYQELQQLELQKGFLEDDEDMRPCTFCNEFRSVDFDLCCPHCDRDDQCMDCLKVGIDVDISELITIGDYAPPLCFNCTFIRLRNLMVQYSETPPARG